MRQARLKMEGTGVYHCITRTVAGERLLDAGCREVLRKMLWQVAGFCGVEVLSYCLMSNHFHVLVRVPERGAVSREELVHRYGILYAQGRAPYQPDPEVLAMIFAQGTEEEAAEWEGRLLRRMGDVSEFMKTLKQRFTVWYNKSHQRFGTLWAERFKSVVVENDPASLKMVAAYIDLNPVRAGLVQDPGDYRWSSYGEAMGGGSGAQAGLAAVLGRADWGAAADDYRLMLFGKGSNGRLGEEGIIPREKVMAVLSAGGKVPRSSLLRCRVRYFTDGAVLGSQAFVSSVGVHLGRKSRAGAWRQRRSTELPVSGDEPLVTLRALRKTPVS